jgi:hypothetical protein
VSIAYNKNIIIITGILIICLNYIFRIFINFDFNQNDLLYLSLSTISDMSYLDLLLREKLSFFYSINENLNFFTLLYTLDRFFIKIFGIKHFWVVLIFYKILAFIILFKGLDKLFNFKNLNLLVFSVSLAIIFCIDIPPFHDRYPRPQLNNIFIFFIITSSFIFLTKNKQSKFVYFMYGVSQAIIAFTSPWASASLFILSAISFFYKTDKNSKAYILFGFLIIFLPTLIMYYISSANSFHSEYLGIKEIYNRFNFIIDFYKSILLSKKFILLMLFQIFIGLFLKSSKELILIVVSAIFAPILFAILGKTVQSYHLLNIFIEFQIVVGIYVFFKLIDALNDKNYIIFKQLIIFVFFTLSISLIFILGNSWLDRSKEIRNKFVKYKNQHIFLNKKQNKCTLITNNKDLYFYWLNFRKGSVLPKDGFTRNEPISNTIDEIKIFLKKLSEIQRPNKEDINLIIKLATHNYYTSTRSTIANTLEFENYEKKNLYLQSRSKINSMKSWAIAPDDNVYSLLEKFEETELPDRLKNNVIIIYNDYKNNTFLIKDNCIL